MDKLPKLKVCGLDWNAAEKIITFEQAQYFPFCNSLIITVEDQVINSYEDLLNLVAKKPYRDMEYLNVAFVPIIVGG